MTVLGLNKKGSSEIIFAKEILSKYQSDKHHHNSQVGDQAEELMEERPTKKCPEIENNLK